MGTRSNTYERLEAKELPVVNMLALQSEQHRVRSDDADRKISATSPFWGPYTVAAIGFRCTEAAQWDWFEFAGYVMEWKATRKMASSFAKDLVTNQGYLNIIGMGTRAIPCVLQQLQR